MALAGAGLPAPVVPLASPGGAGVWGIRFATPEHGFVFGDGLWETTDGGQHWTSAAYPGGSILSLAAIDGQVLTLTATCTAQGGCAQTGTLLRRPLAGGAWSQVTQVHTAGITDPTDMIATQAGVAAVLDGSDVVVTGNGGMTITRHPTPCGTTTMMRESSVAVIAPDGLALLCTGQGYTGHTVKTVYTSGNLGATWIKAGVPGSAGDGGTIAAANPTQLVIATASAASWLYYSGDGAAQWQTALTEPDGGQGWADLGFTTASDGVVIHGPASQGLRRPADAHPGRRPDMAAGQLLNGSGRACRPGTFGPWRLPPAGPIVDAGDDQDDCSCRVCEQARRHPGDRRAHRRGPADGWLQGRSASGEGCG